MKLTFYIFGFFLLTGCGRGYEVKELYSQQIENSEKTIIEYQAWSTLNDGSKYGKTILDKKETISIRDAEQMPFSFLVRKSTKDTLYVLEFKEGGTRIPKYITTEISNFKGQTIKTDYYTYEIGTSHNLTYKFSNFRETNDSLIITGLEKDYFNIPTNNTEIGFLKGNIKLIESDSLKGVIRKIKIPAFLFKNYSMNSVDNLTVIRNDSIQIDGLVCFTFEPTREINTSEFTDYGVYKRRDIKDVRTVQ